MNNDDVMTHSISASTYSYVSSPLLLSTVFSSTSMTAPSETMANGPTAMTLGIARRRHGEAEALGARDDDGRNANAPPPTAAMARRLVVAARENLMFVLGKEAKL